MINEWNINPDRVRKEYKSGDRHIVVYWDVNSENGICLDPDLRDPVLVSRESLVGGGYKEVINE